MFHRERPEQEYQPLYEQYGIGTTTWSPLASGLLTGKVRRPVAHPARRALMATMQYNSGIPENSRLATHSDVFQQTLKELRSPEGQAKLEKVRQLSKLATEELDSTPAAVALAWIAKVNPYTSTIILGASSPEQVKENLRAIDVLPKLTPEVMERIEKILENKPPNMQAYARAPLDGVRP
jgi:aryl-alcohol dehydrogenase-like predicted oxidoreductase